MLHSTPVSLSDDAPFDHAESDYFSLIASLLMPKKSAVTIGIAGIGIVALSIAAWTLNRSSTNTLNAAPVAITSVPSGASGGPVSVEAVKLVATTLLDDVGAVGSVRSNESIVLRPEVAGRIAAINFREGQVVKRGQTLVTLDASVNRAEVDQMRAQLDLAASNLKRTDELARANFVSASAKDEAASKMRVAEATLALAQAKLSKMTLTAPFDGVVGIRNVSVGDYVKDGADLINLEDIGSVKIDFHLPERYQPQVTVGQQVDVTSDALPGQRFAATIAAIDPLIDANGRSVSIRARAPNSAKALRPGMFARVRVIFAEKRGAILVPEEAIVPSGSDFYIYRVIDGTARRTRVKIGARRNAKVDVLEGAQAGDVVVVAGQLKLIRDAMPVTVVDVANAVQNADPNAVGTAGAPRS